MYRYLRAQDIDYRYIYPYIKKNIYEISELRFILKPGETEIRRYCIDFFQVKEFIYYNI